MTDTAYEEGRRAAADDIPAEANPYDDKTREHARWLEGHTSIAQTLEAAQSEGT
jgi:hypothetical protein